MVSGDASTQRVQYVNVCVGLTSHHIMDAPVTRGSSEVTRLTPREQHAHLNGCVPLSHQVAGHKYGVDKVGILQHPDGTVLKQLQPPPRGPREMQFYSMVYAEDCCDPRLVDLRQHLPTYYGTWSSPDTPTDLYLKLEDVTRRFQKPCIMDVKIGQKSYDPFASQEKREQQIKKYPLMEEMGFLLLGMRVYKTGSDSFDTYDQHYGRGLGKETVREGLSKFFFNGDVLRKDAVSGSILKIQRILEWFEGQSQLSFYASSLLFVYEGACPQRDGTLKPEVCEQNNNIAQSLSTMFSLHKKVCVQSRYPTKQDNGVWKSRQQPNGNRSLRGEAEELKSDAEQDRRGGVEVKMIDFAHVFPSDSHDQGYIYGLKNLLKVLHQILEE